MEHEGLTIIIAQWDEGRSWMVKVVNRATNFHAKVCARVKKRGAAPDFEGLIAGCLANLENWNVR